MDGIGIFAPPRRVVSVPENGPVDLFNEQPAVAGPARGPRSGRGPMESTALPTKALFMNSQ